MLDTFGDKDDKMRKAFAEKVKNMVGIEKKLRQVGFKVENKQAVDELPVRWLIAVK